jgi:hypothetical protein
MDRRQVIAGFLATVGASGASALIASLDPTFSKSEGLLRALGAASAFGAVVGFLVLLITAPTHHAEGAVPFHQEPFLTEQMRGLIVLALCVGIPFFLMLGLVIFFGPHQAAR